MTKLRLCVALLVLVMLTSACSSPTGPSPVVTAPGPIVEAPPSVQVVGQIRGFDLKPNAGNSQGGRFTKTAGPVKVLLFMRNDSDYRLRITVSSVEDAGLVAMEVREISFKGKEAQLEIEYDNSRCTYKSLADGSLQCSLGLQNLDQSAMAFGDARMEGVPIR